MMAHLGETFPVQLELGAGREEDWGTDVVTTDGSYEVRNNRWSAPLRKYSVSIPPSERTGDVYRAVMDLYAQAEGMLHSFNFVDWTDETGMTKVPVRFNSPLASTALSGWLEDVQTIELIEVRL